MKLRCIHLLFVVFMGHIALKAQVINNLVVFCNEGERFTLILNGLKQNQTPETNVRVEGLDLKVYQVKIIFENHKLKDHSTTLTFFRTGKECVFALNKHGKKHTMDYVSEKEIDGFLNPAIPQNTNTVNTVTEPQTQPNSQTTTNNNDINTNPTNNNNSNFQTTLSTIASQPTETDKLNTALDLLKSKTFSVADIKQIMALFSSEQARLTFAKQACTQLKDPSVYGEIINSFIAEPIKQELKKYFESKK